MSLGVEDNFIEVQCLWWRGQQVKVFESLGKEKAGH
jgi:hypothetical protein